MRPGVSDHVRLFHWTCARVGSDRLACVRPTSRTLGNDQVGRLGVWNSDGVATSCFPHAFEAGRERVVGEDADMAEAQHMAGRRRRHRAAEAGLVHGAEDAFEAGLGGAGASEAVGRGH